MQMKANGQMGGASMGYSTSESILKNIRTCFWEQSGCLSISHVRLMSAIAIAQ